MINQNGDGKTYLVSLAISKYRHFSSLPTAVKDSEDLVQILTEKYDVELHEKLYDHDVNRLKIKLLFQELRKKVKINDSLIVAFNGHGQIRNERLYLSFTTDLTEAPEKWYPITELFAELEGLNLVKNIGLIFNNCFSGNVFEQPDALPLKTNDNRYHSKTRVIFASGRKDQLVPDFTTSNSSNSPFVAAILDVLKASTKEALSFGELISSTKELCRGGSSGLQPTSGPFRGDQRGELYLYLKDQEPSRWEIAKQEDSIESYTLFLRSFNGSTSHLVESARARREDLLNEQDQWLKSIESIIGTMGKYIEETNIQSPKYLEQAEKILATSTKIREEITLQHRMEKEWTRIKSRKRVEDFRRFIQLFPKTNYATKAKLIIENLNHEKILEDAWAIAIQRRGSLQNRSGRLANFILKHRNSHHLIEAVEKKRDLDLWISVTEEEVPKTKRERAKQYLEEFRKGEYATKAKEIVEALDLDAWVIAKETAAKKAFEDNDIKTIKEILNEFESSTQNQKEATLEVRTKLNRVVESYEEECRIAYEVAIDADSAWRFREFIEKYEDSEPAAELKKRFADKDYRMFSLAEESRDLIDFWHYLMEFEEQGGRYEADCRDRIRELEYYHGLQDKEGYLDYIREYEYQSGLMLEEAREKVAEFERQERKAELLQEIQVSRSVDLCTVFLDEFEEEDEKRTIVETILSELLQEEEASQLYQSIVTRVEEQEEPLQDIMVYLAKFPEGEHILEVKVMEQGILNRQKAEEALVEARAAGPGALLAYKERYDYNHEEADEHLLYQSIKESQDIAKYQKYLDKYGSDGLYANRVQEHIEFCRAKERGNIEEVMAYIQNYGDRGLHFEDAKALHHQLLLRKQEKEGFQKAKELGTIEGFEYYLRQSYTRPPENEKYVRERIKKLRRKESDRKLYEEAVEQDSEDLYLVYLNKYGREGDFYREVTKCLQRKSNGLQNTEQEISEKFDKFIFRWRRWIVGFTIVLIVILLLSVLDFFMK